MSSQENNAVPETGDVRVSAAAVLMVCFIVMILLPGLLQPILERAGHFDRLDSGSGKLKPDRRLQELDIITGLGGLDVFGGSSAEGDGKKRRLLNHIEDYEEALEDRSVFSDAVRPLTQWVQFSFLRQGNEKVAVGKDSWLFYRPGIESVTAKGFLGDAAATAVAPGVAVPQKGDPLPVILKFHKDLKALGIDLFIVPVPVKASIYPDRIARNYDGKLAAPINRQVDAFYRELSKNGVAHINLADLLWNARKETNVDLFLPLDTHWSPRGMDICAEALAGRLKDLFPYIKMPDGEEYTYECHAKKVANHGDVYDMLKMSNSSDAFSQNTVTIRSVTDETSRQPVLSDSESPIILLGDSAANIFSIKDMGWGEHAGLAEQLTRYLGRPIDWIAVDGGAPSLTREKLAQRGLAGKKLVVWEFIMRDLTDPITPWSDVEFPEAMAAENVPDHIEVKARIVKITKTPTPDAAEMYPNTTTYTLYEIQEIISQEGGEYNISELVTVEWVRKDMDYTDAADFKVGDEHHLVLSLLMNVEKNDPALRSARYVNDVRRPDLPAFWVVKHK